MHEYTFDEPSEIKIILMFIIKRFDEPVDNGKITDIFMEHNFVDYFTMQKYLDELVENDLVSVYVGDDKVRKYELSSVGEDAFPFFAEKIPLSTRERILANIKRYKKNLYKQKSVVAEVKPLNELEYAAHLEINENGTPLIHLTVNAETPEMAKKMVENFKKYTPKIYGEIMVSLSKDRPKRGRPRKNK